MARIDYNRAAPAYAASRALPAEALEGWREAVRPHLGAPAATLVLDVGAGTGTFANAFARWFGTAVVALEPSAGMRREAVRAGLAPGVSFVAGTAETLPLRDSSCRAAWLSTVIHHIRDLTAAARELRRVLPAGAPLLIRSSFPGRHEHIALFRFFPGASRVASGFPTVEETVAAFEVVGFAFESLEPVAQVSAPTLQAFRERVQLRADSTLQPLTHDEFAAGLAALDAAIAAQPQPSPVVDRLDLLVLR